MVLSCLLIIGCRCLRHKEDSKRAKNGERGRGREFVSVSVGVWGCRDVGVQVHALTGQILHACGNLCTRRFEISNMLFGKSDPHTGEGGVRFEGGKRTPSRSVSKKEP